MITERRKRILEYIINFKNQNGTYPTIREIGEHFNIRSTNGVREHLKALEKEGYIDIKPQKARSISLKNSANTIPFLGEVAAGEPIYPNLTEGEVIKLPTAIKFNKNFILKVRGDSMINIGINNNDMVVVDVDKEVKNGDIVVALVDSEVTLKRLVISNNEIELHPENNNYNIIKVGQKDFRIIGKISYLIRKF